MPRGVSRWDISWLSEENNAVVLQTKRNNRPWARWGCINVKTACSMKYLPEMNWLEPEATMFEDVWREDYFCFFLGGIISKKVVNSEYYFRFNLSASVRKSLNDVFAKICCDQELRPDYSFGKAIWEPALKEATSNADFGPLIAGNDRSRHDHHSIYHHLSWFITTYIIYPFLKRPRIIYTYLSSIIAIMEILDSGEDGWSDPPGGQEAAEEFLQPLSRVWRRGILKKHLPQKKIRQDYWHFWKIPLQFRAISSFSFIFIMILEKQSLYSHFGRCQVLEVKTCNTC